MTVSGTYQDIVAAAKNFSFDDIESIAAVEDAMNNATGDPQGILPAFESFGANVIIEVCILNPYRFVNES